MFGPNLIELKNYYRLALLLCGSTATHDDTVNTIFLAAAVVKALHHHLFDRWQMDDDGAAAGREQIK